MIKQQQTQQTQQELKIDLNLHQLIILTQELLKDLISSQGNECQSMFNSQQIPSITLQAYLRRLHKYTKFSPQCLIIAIIYFDRYNMHDTYFCLNWYNVHRLLLTCLMMAVKFHDDIYFDNLTFEKGGGVSASQLFAFEIELFSKMDYNAYVEQEEYEVLFEKLYSVYSGQEDDEQN